LIAADEMRLRYIIFELASGRKIPAAMAYYHHFQMPMPLIWLSRFWCYWWRSCLYGHDMRSLFERIALRATLMRILM
jgi:hypothetical protein